MNTLHVRMLCCVLAIGTAGAIVGCTHHDPATYVASAHAYIAKSDYKAAIIELKNALQLAPDNAEARLMLANALFAIGDVGGAETEVRKAIALQASPDEAYPLLARALVAQGKFKDVISETGTRTLDKPAARADLAASLAAAYLAQGDLEKANPLLDAALTDNPADVRALLMKGQLAGQRGDLPAARDFVKSALASSPDNADALLMSAQIELASGNAEAAQKVLQSAIDTHPGLLAPRFAMVSLAMKSGKRDIAKAQVGKMNEIAPADSRTLYADALLAYADNDNNRARQDIEKVLTMSPDHLPSLLLSGLVNYRLGAYAAAEDALRKVDARAPNDPSVVRALATLYLRTGRASQAVQTLEPALRQAPDDPTLLRMSGEAYLASGDAVRAEKAYTRANAIGKPDIGNQVRLAQVRLAAGDTARAFSDLESIATSDSTKYQADLALFSSHLRRREFDKAMAAVDALEKKQPEPGLVPYLRGTVYIMKRDLKNARASYEAALKAQPNAYAPAYDLALIDMQEGHPQLARERYDRLLAKDPKNEQLLLASAEWLAASGGSAEQIKAALDKAVAANPNSRRSRLALITWLARNNDGKAAVAAAQAALSAIPNDAQLTEALGAAQMGAGETNQAAETFRRLVDLQPKNALALLRLAEAQAALKDFSGAVVSERKALALNPDLPQASIALARTYLQSGRPDDAIVEARKLQKEQPSKAIGYALEGEILAAQKKLPEATDAFRKALSHEPQPLLATRTYALLQATGKTAEATAMAKKWMSDHPKDTTVLLFLTQQDLQRKDLPAARAGYERALEIDPDNMIALNNLAWMLTEARDPKGLEYAEHAHRLAPFNPTVLDTLGWSLAQNGQAKRGVELLRMATSLAPNQDTIRLHFAKALLESGDKAGAKQQLAGLSKLDKASPIRIEAEKLLATL